MKISKLFMVFFLLTVLCICSISEVNSLLTKKSTKYAENISSEKPKKAKKKAIKPEENTFGRMVKAHTTLKSPPWKVERCDQIVIAKRKMIPDHEDFTKRRDVVITITAYYINLFAAENPDKLLHSILFTDSKQFPVMQRGARGCVRVHGGGHIHSIIICGNNKKEGHNLLAAINKFSACRGGEKKPKKDEMQKYKNAMRACGLNAGFTDPKAIKKKIKELKKKAKKDGNHLKRSTDFFHPGFAGVPGTDK